MGMRNTLLRMLPVFIGSRVPEGDNIWEILMELKDKVELSVSHSFTDNTIQYMASKILDHRQLLQEVFPNLRLRPKYHYIEHDHFLIKCFGPLVHLWTMRFEGKHKVFKKIVCDTHNYKSVLKTLAEGHQNMMLSCHKDFSSHQYRLQTWSLSLLKHCLLIHIQ